MSRVKIGISINLIGGYDMEQKRTRLEMLKEYIDSKLHNIHDPFEKRCSFIHLYGVSAFCTMVAAKRGQNIELSAMAGMLHDFYLYYIANDPNRVFTKHGELGAVFVRKVLGDLGFLAQDEIDIICAAIHNHSYKDRVDNDFDELLKDAEVLQKLFYDIEFEPHHTYRGRIPKLIEEFGLMHLKGYVREISATHDNKH